MRLYATLFLAISVLAGTAVSADNDVIDCSHRSLAHEVKNAAANQTIRFTGVCAGPIVIRRNGITLKGIGSAVIDGGGSDAVTTTGAGRVSLTDFEVRNGLDGIVALNGANIQLISLNVHDNAVFGISLPTTTPSACRSPQAPTHSSTTRRPR
jgi:hypothetical protein